LRWVIPLFAGAAAFLGIVEWEILLRHSGEAWFTPQVTLFDNVYSFLFILTFIAFSDITLPFAHGVREIGTNSFGIYLMHAPVQEFVARALYHAFPIVLAYQVLFQPALVIVSLAVPLFVIAAVKRSRAAKLQLVFFG
jgi:peptidoglycan/LPS O-acetylase OafA/YrhL